MSFLNQITSLVKDPPPRHLFELSEAGIAFAHDTQTGFQAFAPGTLVASPLEDNILQPDLVTATLAQLAPSNGSKRRRRAAVILPDYAARVSVLDFDSFPSAAEEQLSLVKFRVKKTIPFDIDSAAVSYCVQPAAVGGKASTKKRIEVLAVTVAVEVIARYEAVVRAAGFQPGVVTTSTLAALDLYEGDGVAVFAKLAGRTMTVAAIAGKAIKLFRCVTLEQPSFVIASEITSEEEIMGVLHPTFAYVEDELGTPVSKVVLCGFPHPPSALRCEIDTLRSRFGSPGAFNAGLLGYLESEN